MSETMVKDILGNVSFINMGQSPDSIYYNVEGKGLPLIQGNADIKERKSIKRFYTTQITKVCDEGDILMTVRAPVGYVGIASFPSCIGRGVCSIKANGVDSKYLFYLLIQNEDKWKAFEAGTTFSAVTSKEVYNFPILLTKSVTEQRQIALILSTCDAVIEKTRAAIAKYKAIKQGMLHDLFTRGIDLQTGKLRPRYQDAPHLYKESKLGMIPREWEVKVLGNLVSSYSGGTPSRGIESYYKGDIPWVTSSEVNQDEILKTNQHITQDALDNSSAKWVEPNTVLVAMYGATAGQISMLRIRATTNQAVLACPSLCEISSDFLYYLMVFHNYPKL